MTAKDFPEHLVGILEVDAVVADLDRRNALADAEQETAAAHLVEHADFLGQPQRMIERQRINQRPEVKLPGALCDGREIDARRRRHAERRRMVLGAMVAVDAGAVVGLHQLEAVFVEIAERLIVPVDVIEDSEFQRHVTPQLEARHVEPIIRTCHVWARGFLRVSRFMRDIVAGVPGVKIRPR